MIDPFVYGAALSPMEALTFGICRYRLGQVHPISEGEDYASLLQLYKEDGIVWEPACDLALAALASFAEEI